MKHLSAVPFQSVLMVVAWLFHTAAWGESAAVAGAVVTRFEKDATLTAEQVETVVQLAKTCGLAEPVEISIGRSIPVNRRFIIVKGKDHTVGRRFSYDRVDIRFSKWSGSPFQEPGIKRMGEFWVTPPYLVKIHFATFKAGGKSITVDLADGTINLEAADRIIEAFAKNKVRSSKGTPVGLDTPTLLSPNWLGYDKDSKEYIICFGRIATWTARCKLVGEDVVLTMEPTVQIH